MDLLHQFAIKTYIPVYVFGIDFSITNASLFMVASVLIFCSFSYYATSMPRIIPSGFQASIEIFYLFITETIEKFSGKDAAYYAPYIFSIFIFIFFGNFLGLVPGFFTTTSQIIVTFTLALVVFLSVTALGILKHGFGFLRLFLPKDIPWYIAILLVPVEIISYCSRPLSLAVRLFANMVAGHVLLKVFATFAALSIGTYFLPFSIIPIGFNVIFMFFEMVIACLQAYVFTILTCIYLKNALHLH
jgi:F-type H+-transporting ATPase subunit a